MLSCWWAHFPRVNRNGSFFGDCPGVIAYDRPVTYWQIYWIRDSLGTLLRCERSVFRTFYAAGRHAFPESAEMARFLLLAWWSESGVNDFYLSFSYVSWPSSFLVRLKCTTFADAAVRDLSHPSCVVLASLII